MIAKMKGPEGHGGISHEGVSYEPDENGIVEVPQEAVGEAMNHGFTLVAGKAGSKNGAVGGGDQPVDLTKLSKKDLVAHAKDKFGLELDEKKSAKVLIEEIEAAKAAAIQGEGTGAE
jgi:hypothetical protein